MPVRWRDDADSRLQLVRGNLQNAADLLRIRLGSVRDSRQLDLVAEAGEKSKNGCASS